MTSCETDRKFKMYEILEKSLLCVHFALFIHNGGLPKPCDHLFSMKGTRYFHPDIHGRRQVQLKAISFSAGKSSSNGEDRDPASLLCFFMDLLD